jgi:hypothetical protein
VWNITMNPPWSVSTHIKSNIQGVKRGRIWFWVQVGEKLNRKGKWGKIWSCMKNRTMKPVEIILRRGVEMDEGEWCRSESNQDSL